jgi:hypothetical protein
MASVATIVITIRAATITIGIMGILVGQHVGHHRTTGPQGEVAGPQSISKWLGGGVDASWRLVGALAGKVGICERDGVAQLASRPPFLQKGNRRRTVAYGWLVVVACKACTVTTLRTYGRQCFM